MRPFELFQPDNLADASAKASNRATFKAGGIDLLDRLKERVESPHTVIDLWSLRKQMDGIAVADGRVMIGSMATLAKVADAKQLQDPAYTALTQSAGHAATPQIRSRATVGGNLLQLSRCWYLRNAQFACAHSGRGDTCLAQEGQHRYHAVLGVQDCIRVHPSNLAPPLLALGAEVRVQDAEGKIRELPLGELYPEEPLAESPEHTLQEGEILISVGFPIPEAGTRSAYHESREKQAHDWATTAAAARLRMDGPLILDATICLGAVAPTPIVADRAAAVLKGQKASRELFVKAAETAYAGADPLEQNAYKVPVGKAVLIDTLMEASGL